MEFYYWTKGVLKKSKKIKVWNGRVNVHSILSLKACIFILSAMNTQGTRKYVTFDWFDCTCELYVESKN